MITRRFDQAISFFHLNPEYLNAKWVFFLLGITAIIETGTGVNSQIIGTSTYWRFELWTSLLLTSLIIPLSYFLTIEYGLIGPAVANLVSFSIYNIIRYLFLWRKFGLQPFSMKTVEIIVATTLTYFVCHLVFNQIQGLPGLILRTGTFILLCAFIIYWRNISPDVKPVIQNLLKRFQRTK